MWPKLGVGAFHRHTIIFLVLGLMPGTLRCQQTSPVTLQVAPKDLAVAPGERRHVLVIATVTGSQVRNLKLRAWSDPATHVTIDKPAEVPGEVRGDVSWPISITEGSAGQNTAGIVFGAEYESGDKTAASPGLAQTTFNLSIKQRPKNDDVATAAVQTSMDKLEERRPQDVYLVVTNLTEVPLEVTDIRVSLPGFARLTVDGADVNPAGGVSTVYSPSPSAKPLSIPPRQEHLFPMELKIPEYTAVLTGKYLMIFEVGIRYAKDGYTTQSRLVATQQFQAGVLGEQEFVGITSVPFLLLPGFLIVTILGLLLSKVWPKWAIDPDFKKPEFYLAGAVVSLMTVLLYKPLSPWLYMTLRRVQVPQRDLFSGFSLQDIVNIWALAVAVALIPWIVVGGSVRIYAFLKARALKDRTPTTHDRPIDVLVRLVRARKSFILPQAVLAGTRLWELPLPSPDPAKKWVSGRVSVKFTDANGGPANRFRELLNKTNGTQDMYNFLATIGNGGTVTWQPDQPPELVDRKDAPTATGATDDFIIEG